jgi:hypothetical protein
MRSKRKCYAILTKVIDWSIGWFNDWSQISFAERTLLEDDNQLLFKQNNEAKHRRSVKSTVVGKAKVMSYEDIEEARAKRAEKEQATARAKGNAVVSVKALCQWQRSLKRYGVSWKLRRTRLSQKE